MHKTHYPIIGGRHMKPLCGQPHNGLVNIVFIMEDVTCKKCLS